MCKIVDTKEIAENDFSLNPGRYVGFSIHVDMDFDYKNEIKKINTELTKLNEKNADLMSVIKSLNYEKLEKV